jgi:CDGSH-type Zn-finger protein
LSHFRAGIGNGVPDEEGRAMGTNMDGPAAKITPYRNGPYLIRGPFVMADQDGNEISVGRRVVALCRCGRSRTRPFCDGTHKAIGFRADSGPGEAGEDARMAPAQAAQRRGRVAEAATAVEDSASQPRHQGQP